MIIVKSWNQELNPKYMNHTCIFENFFGRDMYTKPLVIVSMRQITLKTKPNQQVL